MRLTRKEELPLIGSSYNFVGADQGDVAISMFLVEARPGRGAPLHFHEYDEIAIVQEGQSRFVIGDEILEASAGAILVVKAGTSHGFVNPGPDLLRQIDIHVSPRFKQVKSESDSRVARSWLARIGAIGSILWPYAYLRGTLQFARQSP